MRKLRELTTHQASEWLEAIERCAPYDFYHLPQYHALSEELGEGNARLFVYTEGKHVISLPLLLRSLEGIAGSDAIGTGWMDATSVYGYPGPIASATLIPREVIDRFQAALSERLRAWRVVSVFSRMNPLLAQRPLLEGVGCFHVSQTVSIDLTLPVAVQRSKYRRSFKEAINRLRRRGLTVLRDVDGSYCDAFVAIYYETMRRVEAADHYFFPASYFARLGLGLGSQLHRFVCLQEGRAVCTGVFVSCHGILQYHLGGTLNDAIALAPMKLVIDEVRLWGVSQGLRVMHLGGGATSAPDDPLLYFKRGFSDRQHEFSTWRYVVAPKQDALLCQEYYRRLASQGLRPMHGDYFPVYRAPGEPCDPIASASAASESCRKPSPLFSGETP